MSDYTIAENYTLPSKGKIYDIEVDPHIKIRSMTTQEEMKRLAPSDLPYKNMCEIIDDCLVEGPDISAYDMCIGDYQFLLHKLRVVTYGNKYSISNVCPFCNHLNTRTVNLDELQLLTFEEDLKKYLEFDLPVTKKHIKLNVQTPRMLDNVTELVKEFRRKSNNAADDPSLIYTICQLIDTVDNKRQNPIKLEQWVRELPMKDTNTILSYAEKINTSIGVKNDLAVQCELCTLEYNTVFKMTNEFFRPALDI